MFSSLRQNSTIYILHRNLPVRAYPVTVLSVTPVQKFGMGQFGQPQIMEVNLTTISANGETRNFEKLPASENVATFFSENITICTSRDAVNAEIESMKRKSTDILNSFDYHKQVISSCEDAFAFVNPEIEEKREQENLIKTLSERLATLSKQVEQLTRKSDEESAEKSAEISNESKK